MGQKRNSKLENFILDHEMERLLRKEGWLEFIHMYEGFKLDLVEEFVMNFRVNATRVRGEVIEITPIVISELSKIPAEGEPVNK